MSLERIPARGETATYRTGKKGKHIEPENG